jgi:hypothetical protein
VAVASMAASSVGTLRVIPAAASIRVWPAAWRGRVRSRPWRALWPGGRAPRGLGQALPPARRGSGAVQLPDAERGFGGRGQAFRPTWPADGQLCGTLVGGGRRGVATASSRTVTDSCQCVSHVFGGPNRGGRQVPGPAVGVLVTVEGIEGSGTARWAATRWTIGASR